MGNSSHLFESLFRTSPSSDGLQAYLAQAAAEHPYFSPLQFFLLQQLETETPDYKLQAAKTAILFNNAYWLSFQLSENENIVSRPQDAETLAPEPTNADAAPVDGKEDNTLNNIDQSNSELIEEPTETLNGSDEVENFFNEGVDEDISLEKPVHNDDTPVAEIGVHEGIGASSPIP